MLSGTVPPTISSLAFSLVFPSSGIVWLMYRRKNRLSRPTASDC
jgi:hypothetical protein